MITVRYFFFFNDTATTEIYTLSLHDALPIYATAPRTRAARAAAAPAGIAVVVAQNPRSRPRGDRRRPAPSHLRLREIDRKSTRLNSSHANISYAVFCLKKKNSLLNLSTLHS